MNEPMHDETFKRLATLYFEDAIDENELEQLNVELSRSDDRVREFNDLRLLLGLIHEHGQEVTDTDDTRDSEQTASKRLMIAKRLPRNQAFFPWSVAAALALLLLYVQFLPQRTRQPHLAQKQDAYLGLLVDQADAKFEPGFAPEDVHFEAREYRLQSGAIYLRLKTGADLVMNGPAAFRLHDLFHLELINGSLRAIAPPAAQGLTIAAPEVNYEDLGTEFAVSVDQVSGTSSVHVFDGRVDVKEAGTNKLLTSFTSGKTMKYVNHQWQPVEKPGQDEFLEPGQVGLLRWQAWCKQFVKDPSLIAFYDFSVNGKSPDKLLNQAGDVSDGTIEGARWVSGRWPGKAALLFDRDSDFVEIEIPGEYEALTFAAWIKLDRLRNGLSSLFSTSGFLHGDIHWDIASDGTMRLTRRFSKTKDPGETPLVVPSGQWVHVAGTISDKERCLYLNGKLAGYQTGQRGPLKPGVGRIGQWLRHASESGRRPFYGRMDELAIWKRDLSPSEIKHLVEVGKPDTLWSINTMDAKRSQLFTFGHTQDKPSRLITLATVQPFSP